MFIFWLKNTLNSLWKCYWARWKHKKTYCWITSSSKKFKGANKYTHTTYSNIVLSYCQEFLKLWLQIMQPKNTYKWLFTTTFSFHKKFVINSDIFVFSFFIFYFNLINTITFCTTTRWQKRERRRKNWILLHNFHIQIIINFIALETRSLKGQQTPRRPFLLF